MNHIVLESPWQSRATIRTTVLGFFVLLCCESMSMAGPELLGRGLGSRLFCTGVSKAAGFGLTGASLPRLRQLGRVPFDTKAFEKMTPRLEKLSDSSKGATLIARDIQSKQEKVLHFSKRSGQLEGFYAKNNTASNVLAHGTNEDNAFGIHYGGFVPQFGGLTSKMWIEKGQLDSRRTALAEHFAKVDFGTAAHAMPVELSSSPKVITQYAEQTAFTQGGKPVLLFFPARGKWLADPGHPGMVFTREAFTPGESTIIATDGRIVSFNEWAETFSKQYPRRAEEIKRKVDQASIDVMMPSDMTKVIDETLSTQPSRCKVLQQCSVDPTHKSEP